MISNKVWRSALAICALGLVPYATACGSDDSEGGMAGASGMSGDPDGGSGSGGSGDPDGGAGSGGSGGGGSNVGDGEPLEAPAMQWTWIDFPDSFCRDGSNAGLGVSLNPASDKVMIFMQGGGACFDFLTCGTNPASAAMQKGEQTTGLFNRAEPTNPVADWNHIFIPYCTGDVHLGTKEDGTVEGVNGTQMFVGRNNVLAYLKRIVPTFPDATQVLLTGISAGGFGAAANMEVVQEAFGDIPVTAIDDSGPPM